MAGARRWPVSRSGPWLGLLHFVGRNDADDFAALDLAALHELDPAIEIRQLAGDGRLRGLRREPQGVPAAWQRLAVRRHRRAES